MQIMTSILCVVAAFTLTTNAATAQVQQARGKATVTYSERSVSPQAKTKAIGQAQLKAVEFYFAEAGESESANFDAIREKIASNPDRYILDTTVLSEEDSVATKQYTVAVRVQLNVANLRNDIKAGSAVAKANPNERSALAFLFVSREVESVKSFDTRVTQRSDRTVRSESSSATAQSGTEGERVRQGQVNTHSASSGSASRSATTSMVRETGGTQTRRSAESTWRLFPSANLNQVFTQIFGRAGFKVNEASFVEPYSGGKFSVAMVENDYRNGNDLQSTTLQGIAQGMRQAQIPYMALGTLDVGMADDDRATGMKRVSVTVNARVLDLTQAIPSTIASVGPVGYAGVGPTEDEARASALRLAANNAARDLTSQLTQLGLK